jgi:DNA-binding transcriptional regulator YiaG
LLESIIHFAFLSVASLATNHVVCRTSDNFTTFLIYSESHGIVLIQQQNILLLLTEHYTFLFFICKGGTTMTANEIKQILKEKRIYQWEVAKALGITEFTLTRWLREDLSAEKAEQIMLAVDKVLKELEIKGVK